MQLRRSLRVTASNSNNSKVEIIEIEFCANVTQITSADSAGDSTPKEDKLSTYKKIFNAFVDNAIRLMKEKHSKIVDIHQSNRARSNSWYVSMYSANAKVEVKSKYLLIFRFSDHSISNFEERSAKYRDELAQANKLSEQSKQLNIPFEIVVRKDNNENHFKSFAEALDYVNTILENEQR